MNAQRPVWAEVSLSAIRNNLLQIKSLLSSGTLFCPVVKADGYGHGAIAVAREAVAVGADYLGLAIVEEAISLRQAGIICPCIVFGYTPLEQSTLIVENEITQTVFCIEQVEALARAADIVGKTPKVHVKVDTGMSRLGIRPEDTLAFCKAVNALGGVELEGIFTHFATADSRDKTRANKQFAAFLSVLHSLERNGIRIPIRHCANSAAILDLPETHLDMVRSGIITYGLWPSEEVTRPIHLEPAMRLKAKLSMVKDLEVGTPVGYGASWHAQSKSRIATIPIGYADGYTRLLSAKASVVIAGHRAPLVGKICMDQCMADVTALDLVFQGEEVLLFGGPDLPVDELASLLGTINYEIVTMVSKRVPRIYV